MKIIHFAFKHNFTFIYAKNSRVPTGELIRKFASLECIHFVELELCHFCLSKYRCKYINISVRLIISHMITNKQ